MRAADAWVARGLADLAAEGGLHDADAAIHALRRRLCALPGPEREHALHALVAAALESFVSRCGAASLAEAGRRAGAMLGLREPAP